MRFCYVTRRVPPSSRSERGCIVPLAVIAPREPHSDHHQARTHGQPNEAAREQQTKADENEQWKANSGTRLRRHGLARSYPPARVCGPRNGNSRSSSILAVAFADR
jgi:hypothetical protein